MINSQYINDLLEKFAESNYAPYIVIATLPISMPIIMIACIFDSPLFWGAH